MHENGPGSSPIVWGNLVILTFDGSDKQFMAALDKNTGKIVWKTDRSGELNDNPQLQKSYGTPLILDVQGRPLLISPGADWLYAYEPGTGKEVWKLNYGTLGFSISSRPVVGNGMLYMSTGFMRPNILAVRYDSASSPEIAWRYTKGAPQIPSPLLVGEELYFVTDSGGIVTCLDAHTGEEHYRERLGGNFNASPFYADGRIFFCAREGMTVVLKPGKRFEVLARNELPGQIMATPAVVDGAIYLRTDGALYCISKTTGE
jgi:outer membrane protein assembly factor BamB